MIPIQTCVFLIRFAEERTQEAQRPSKRVVRGWVARTCESADGLVPGSGQEREFRRAEPRAKGYNHAHGAALDTPGVLGFMKAKRRKAAEEC